MPYDHTLKSLREAVAKGEERAKEGSVGPLEAYIGNFPTREPDGQPAYAGPDPVMLLRVIQASLEAPGFQVGERSIVVPGELSKDIIRLSTRLPQRTAWRLPAVSGAI
jgi:hypothetical protein